MNANEKYAPVVVFITLHSAAWWKWPFSWKLLSSTFIWCCYYAVLDELKFWVMAFHLFYSEAGFEFQKK